LSENSSGRYWDQTRVGLLHFVAFEVSTGSRAWPDRVTE